MLANGASVRLKEQPDQIGTVAGPKRMATLVFHRVKFAAGRTESYPDHALEPFTAARDVEALLWTNRSLVARALHG